MAIIGDQYDHNRQQLHKVVPLDVPFSITFEPSTCCNLKCHFCEFSCSQPTGFKRDLLHRMMTKETFDRAIEQLKEFPHPVKTFSFVGLGEPLSHPKLPEMVAKVKESQMAERIFIVTNGTLLTHDLTDCLVESGVDTIKISVNGLCDQDYMDNCRATINFEQYLEQIRYLYQHKKDCKILVKIVRTVLKDRPEEYFYSMFNDICDSMSIERVVDLFDDVNYSDINTANMSISRYDSVTRPVKVCAAPFIKMVINVDGSFCHCSCLNGIRLPNESIYTTTIKDFWQGESHNNILRRVLKQDFTGCTEKCAQCFMRNDFAFEEDNLDSYAAEIYQRIGCPHQ